MIALLVVTFTVLFVLGSITPLLITEDMNDIVMMEQS